MKVEESLNVTFDESHPLTKLSPLVDDDVGEEEAIENNTKLVNNNNIEEVMWRLCRLHKKLYNPLDSVPKGWEGSNTV
ncbi:hypothetical protein Tco_1120036 [Tanacetum coccineum]